MAVQSRPAFFCARPDGAVTPMIAMDELPSNIHIRGVPRTLTPGETQGMTSCGVADIRAEPWVVDGLPSVSIPIVKKDSLLDLESVLIKIASDTTVAPHHRLAVQNILFHGLDSLYVSEIMSSSTVAPQQTSAVMYGNETGTGQRHTFSKKEYCSYWIRHGECDYQQQGCMFKHEMPTDPAMLEKLGLRDIPRWYREKYNVPSLLSSNYVQTRGQNHAVSMTDQPVMRAIDYPSQPVHVPVPNQGSTAATTTNNNNQRGGNGRYKATRGPGYNNSKPRGHGHWNNKNNRNNVQASLQATPPGNGSSSSTSNSDPYTPGHEVSIKNLSPMSMETHTGLSAFTPSFIHGKVMDNEANVLAGRLQNLGTQDVFASTLKDSDKSLFRTKSRRPFDFGSDGKFTITASPTGSDGNTASATKSSTAASVTDSVANPLVNPQANAISAPIANPLINPMIDSSADATPKAQFRKPEPCLMDLALDSEPILPTQPLLNFGPIGEPVQVPPFQQCNKTGMLFGPQWDDWVKRAESATHNDGPKIDRATFYRY